MTVSKAQQKAVNGYISRNYDRINLTIPKGRKATVEACAKEKGQTVNGYINSLLMEGAGVSEREWKQPVELDGEQYGEKHE